MAVYSAVNGNSDGEDARVRVGVSIPMLTLTLLPLVVRHHGVHARVPSVAERGEASPSESATSLTLVWCLPRKP